MISRSNSPLIDEVVKLLEFDNLFDVSNQDASDFSIIRDIDHAYYLSEESCFGEDEFTWGDIKAHQTRVFYKGHQNSDYQEFRNSFDSIHFASLLQTAIQQRKQKEQETHLHEDFFDTIVNDLYYCAMSRGLQGKQNEFWETIFRIYQCGGVPCGWHGDYPEGKIVAYMPDSD